MLCKPFVLGACLLMLAGCSTPMTLTQSETSMRSQLDHESDSQESAQLAAERVRETRRQSVIAKIQPLEQEMKLIGQRMLGRQQKISDMEIQKNQLVTELNNHDRNVKAFMLKYKTEVGCLGAFGVSLAEGNQYSQDAKNLAMAVTVACGMGVLADGGFGQRVVQVVDQLNQADRYAKDLRSQMQAAIAQLDAENQQLAAETATVNQLAANIQAYQTQLETI